VFGLAPELDLKLAGLFHQPGTTLWLGNLPLLQALRWFGHGWSRWLRACDTGAAGEALWRAAADAPAPRAVVL